ncbi:type II restriction endonuclease [Catenuloplanes indicus]|uniref:Restriction endonuclease n=1 Tax=Catenuloplanes indicus TaxID=137267 RepID=A0AAE3W2J9_9ACTN|nr:type II restriction endonuclease [Catenuloplanes indicus]MDQ0367529.1 hypothetical protein [Catenuloplanes indicus]
MQQSGESPLEWLRRQCQSYTFDALGVYQAFGSDAKWPVQASSPEELTAVLAKNGHLLPLPKEPAALANVVEVSVTDFLEAQARSEDESIELIRGTERGYPDLELTGTRWGGKIFAVDIKVARRADTKDKARTQSRITLYTGNTYFKWEDLHWPGTFRPFSQYSGHFDIIFLYTLEVDSMHRVTDVEILVQEPWRIASKKRSSTTREYIGAVDLIADLRAGQGEFATEDEFYRFWRKFNFKTSAAVANQLQRLLEKERKGHSPS